MEPKTVYDERSRSPLRSRSPPKFTDEYSRTQKRDSPLRHNKSPQKWQDPRGQTLDSEEQRYEERRGEELRRQIRERESELANISQSKDRLRLRIQSQLNQSASQLPQSAFKREKQIPVVPSKKQSPLRLSEQRQTMKPVQTEYKNVTPKVFKLKAESLSSQPELQSQTKVQSEYMGQLNNDNQQLQRRLNLVVAEFDRVTREKALQQQQFQQAKQESDQFERDIEQEQRVDVNVRDIEHEIQHQKDENRHIQAKIENLDDMRNETLSGLNALQADRERSVQNSENLSLGLNQKLRVMKEIESQQLMNHDQGIETQHSIQNMTYDVQQQQNQLPELQAILEKLKRERDDLSQKLHNLNQTYDHAVQDISRERAQIESHNSRHQGLMASKQIFQAVRRMVQARKQAAMSEFFNYCRFDQNCHRTLKAFSTVLQNCGEYQLKLALKKWFQNALKPLQTRQQGDILTYKLSDARLKERIFKYWLNKYRNIQQSHSDKLSAITRIWRIKIQDCQIDKKRGFTIWRDQLLHFRQCQKVIKYLALRHQTKVVKRSFNKFVNWNVTMTHAIREYVLSTQLAETNYQQITLGQLKVRAMRHKRIRLMKLSHLFKAWQDSNKYRRLMMAQNVTVWHMRRQLNFRLKSQCFETLRLNKETEKYQLMLESLNGNYQPALQQLNDQIRQRSQQALKQKRLRALEALSKHAQCKLQSYFNHWSKVQHNVQNKVSKNLKQILKRLSGGEVHQAFDLWKNGTNYQAKVQQTMTIQGLHKDGQKLGQDVSVTTRQVNSEKDRITRNTRTSLQKAVNICVNRFLSISLHRWHQRCQHLNAMEQGGAAAIIKKLRKHLCKQAFNHYLDKIKMMRQEELDDQRCDRYLKMRGDRKKRRIYNAICQYTKQYSIAKRNLGVLYSNADIWLQRRGFYRFAEQLNLKTICLTKQSQNENTLKFEELNANLGQVTKNQTDHSTENNKREQLLKQQAQRILSNAFARFYYSKAQRGIDQWKKVVEYQKHREQFFKNRIDHLRKQMFYFQKSCFQNWIGQTKNKDLKAEIKHTVQLTADTIQLTETTRQKHEMFVIKQQCDFSENKVAHHVLNDRHQKTLSMIVRKNNDCSYQGTLRAVFTQWAAYTKRQVQFIRAITNTISKSMWQNGFTNISAFASDKNRTRTQNRTAMGMKRMFWKKNCSEAFNRWRRNLYQATTSATVKKNKDREVLSENHEVFVEKTKDWNGTRGLYTIAQKDLSDTFQAWKNVYKWQKAAQVKTRSFGQEWLAYQARRCLNKMHLRTKLTYKTRDHMLKFKQFKRDLYLQAAFSALKQRFQIDKSIGAKLANIAAKFDNRMKEISLRAISHFAKNRNSNNSESHDRSARELASILNQLYYTRMTTNLNYLRTKVTEQKSKSFTLKALFGHCYAVMLRSYFEKWRKQSNELSVVEEVNDEGPIVEEVLNEKMRLENLRNFLTDQGYTKLEIQKVDKFATDRSQELLARSIARMRHYTNQGDLYLKPKMFDRWRMYVKIRKLVEHVLANMEAKLQPATADLSIAFNRWKYSKQHLLAGIDRQNLNAKCANDDRHKEQLFSLEDSATQFMNQLTIQRDELVDNYIKSQRLAISLASKNKERAAHKVLIMMSDNTHHKKKQNVELILQRNIDLIQSLKDRIKDFEGDNHSLANENEELRQFSLDGYQIAKNVQSLSYERESLSVDLADKSQTIQKLLDQNQELSHRLKHAQEHAIGLINQSNLNMRRMQTQAQGHQHHHHHHDHDSKNHY